MRVAFFSNSYKPSISGVVTSMSLFREGLIAKGHDVSVIAPEYSGYVDSEAYIFRIPAIDFSQFVDMNLAIPLRGPMQRTITGIQPHVIHSHHPLVVGNLAVSFARHGKLPLVFTFHTRYEDYAHKYIKWMPELAGMVMEEVVERYLRHCDHIIAPTASILNMILNRYAVKAPVTVIPTPVDLTRYANLDPQRVRTALQLDDCEMLLYIGRLSEEKNLSFLVRAFERLLHARPQARLVMVGKGVDEAMLHALVERLRLTGKVIFPGPIPHEDLPSVYAAADLFVFTSKTETQGLALMEAMAAGTPVVAVDADSSRDALEHGGGLLVREREDDFAGAVQALLADPDHLRALSEEAREAAQRYDLPGCVDRLLEVYARTISASYGQQSTLKVE